MVNKTITFIILLVMVFTLCACDDVYGLQKQVNDLTEKTEQLLQETNNALEFMQYKADAKLMLQAYAESKGQENYYEDSWALIQAAVKSGRKAINAASNKPEADFAINTAKDEIDAALTDCTISNIKFRVLADGGKIQRLNFSGGEEEVSVGLGMNFHYGGTSLKLPEI